MLHRTHTCIAISSTDDGEPGHSILQHDMPDQEDPDCPEAEKRRLKHAGAARMSCLAHKPVKKEEWEAWFCQFLGELVPVLEKIARVKSVCACGRHLIDAYGNHGHPCKQHTGSLKTAHQTILDAIEAICRQAGITSERCNIPSVQKRHKKRGRGDLVLKNVTATWFATLPSTTNSVAITSPTSVAMGHSVMRSPTASSRTPLVPRWRATGPATLNSSKPSYPASSPPAGGSTASS